MTPLITEEQRALLLANGATFDTGEDYDPFPVVKLFTPDAGAVWLLTHIEADCTDIAFGLCRAQHKPNYDERIVMCERSIRSPISAPRGRITPHNYDVRAVASIASRRSDTPVNVPFLICGGPPASRISSFSAGSTRR